jgi:hypothetical protein
MPIYKGSRYEGSKVVIEDGVKSLDFRRKRKYKEHKDDRIIQFKRGMRLDLLAKELYGDLQARWVILDANPEYYAPDEIEPGDYLVIPTLERVDV